MEASLIYGILTLIVFILYKKYSYNKRLPPGPWGLPFLGQLVYLQKNNPMIEFQKWKERYGKIFSYSIGNFYVIVLNDYKIIAETLQRDEFLGRPDFESYIVRNQGKKNRGILFSDGVHSWAEQRRFSLRTLRDFGFGKQSMEGLLQYELQDLVKRLRKEGAGGKPMEMQKAFNASVFNSLWYIVSGQRFELDDPKFSQLLGKVQGHLYNITLQFPGHYYPWPAKYNLVRRGAWKAMTAMYQSLLDLFDELIEEHESTYDCNQTRDFIDAFLHQAHESENAPNSSFSKDESRLTLKIVLLDLFSAGTETSSTTLLWAVLYMISHPKIAKKLQQEVDTVIGKGRQPTRDDKPNMVYLEAFTNEVHRKSSLLPMSVYHAMKKDVVYEGKLFPKGAIVFPNLYESHHNKEYWGDPENFRPERFLDPSGTKLVKKDALTPFSTGKRVCLGETLARDTLFIFLAGLIQNFSFELDPLGPPVDFNKLKPMFVVSPDSFKAIIKPRN